MCHSTASQQRRGALRSLTLCLSTQGRLAARHGRRHVGCSTCTASPTCSLHRTTSACDSQARPLIRLSAFAMLSLMYRPGLRCMSSTVCFPLSRMRVLTVGLEVGVPLLRLLDETGRYICVVPLMSSNTSTAQCDGNQTRTQFCCVRTPHTHLSLRLQATCTATAAPSSAKHPPPSAIQKIPSQKHRWTRREE